jgi:hypothetical protein|tara:strand:- start:36 stop:533 length:498 start_codon:yes stop_codon:yes gene_type:complete
MFKNLIYCFSIEEDIKNFKEDLIKECVNQRKEEEGGCNFKVQTKYINNLYKIFIDCAKKILKPFTIKNKNFTVWCYMTDNMYSKTGWHNHKDSATINSVIYLKIKDKGISFKQNNKQMYLEPNNGDMLIFPASLDHKPRPSTDDKRISLNLELKCYEKENEVFNV